ELGVPEVVVLVAVDRFKPRPVAEREALIPTRDVGSHVFPGERLGNQRAGAVRGKGTEIQPGAVERDDETPGIPDQRPSVAGDLCAVVGQCGEGALIARNQLRVAEDLATDRVTEEMGLQAFRDRLTLWWLKEPGIVHQADAHISAF